MERVAYPEWTEYRKKSGLDPLGMQTSSISFYQELLPGISNVTLRVRYYGLYCWLVNQYAEHIGDTNPRSWQRILRRAEALFALIAAEDGQENGVAGITWAIRILGEHEGEFIEFSVDAEPGSDTHYLKQAWGAYGAAYGSQLSAIGLLSSSKDHDIPVLQPDLGEALADAFALTIGQMGDSFFKVVRDGLVTREALRELAPMLPSKISTDDRECELYKEILFAQVDSPTQPDESRKKTLHLILKCAELLGKTPSIQEVRWLLYANCTVEGQPLELEEEELMEQAAHWWTYQANDLIHVVFESFLKYQLDLLESYPSGIALQNLVATAVDNILESMPSAPDSWSDFLGQCVLSDNAASPIENSEKSLTEALLKHGGSTNFLSADVVLKALHLLACVQKRVMLNSEAIAESLDRIRPEPFRSLNTELEYLESVSGLEFSEVLKGLLLERTLRRHIWVATNKIRYQGDYTYLFDSDEGLVRLRAKDGPVLTNPRLGPSIGFLGDIGLLTEVGVSSAGQKLMRQL